MIGRQIVRLEICWEDEQEPHEIRKFQDIRGEVLKSRQKGE
jgi:hypothetical protein